MENTLTCLVKDVFFGEYTEGKFLDQNLREYFPDYTYQGVFFDVGAFEPIHISNIHHFHLNGWDVYCFEANPNKIPFLKQFRKNVFNYAVCDNDSNEPLPFEMAYRRCDDWTASYSAIKVAEKHKKVFPWDDNVFRVETIHVPQRTLNTIIQQEIPELTHIDIMSLDIEGYELECLKGLDLDKFPPKVIVVENIDHDKCIPEYLEKFGYTFDKTVLYNEYYLHKSYARHH